MKKQFTRTRFDANIERYANEYAESIIAIQIEHGITFEQSAKCLELALIQARLSAYIENGDFFDENLYGIGDALESLSNKTKQ
jgi:hypothetical protein